MVEMAEICRIPGPEYRAQFGDRRLPSHLRALQDIEPCRTELLGGQVYDCETCREHHDSYHSCQNRHCPTCHKDQAQQWLEHQENLLVPVPPFMVTFTLPHELRALARRHQQVCYNILLRSSSEALQELARDPRVIGGSLGLVGVLHTWTRDLRDHPHVHSIVPGGGRTADGRWLPARHDFLVPVKPLSVLFRAKFRDALQKTDLFPRVDEQVWPKDWVVHWEPVGHGEEAFRDLAPSLFRVAISNNRILTLQEGYVTFQYKEAATDAVKICTLPAVEFIRRFLQHVLPARFIKVRYDGLLSPTNRPLLNTARELLGTGTVEADSTGHHRDLKDPTDAPSMPRCPTCGSPLRLVQTLGPKGRSPP